MPTSRQNQSVQSLDSEKKEVTMSFSELRANMLCAASLANKERMFETGNRLRHDVEDMETIFNSSDTLIISIKEKN